MNYEQELVESLSVVIEQLSTRMPKPKEPATANLSDVDRVKVSLQHAENKIAYWKHIVTQHQKNGTNPARAIKFLKRAQDSLHIWQGHQAVLDKK